MTVANVIETVEEILNGGSVMCAEENGENVSPDEKYKSLVSCCNFVLEDLYRDYATDCRKTVVEVKNGIADVSGLNMCRVLSLADSSGNSASFTYNSQGLLAETDGRYNLTYARLPQTLTYVSEVVLPDPRITYRIFIYGVIAEYLKRRGDYQKSAVWNDKFVTALSAAYRTCAGVMPVRRWL